MCVWIFRFIPDKHKDTTLNRRIVVQHLGILKNNNNYIKKKIKKRSKLHAVTWPEVCVDWSCSRLSFSLSPFFFSLLFFILYFICLNKNCIYFLLHFCVMHYHHLFHEDVISALPLRDVAEETGNTLDSSLLFLPECCIH